MDKKFKMQEQLIFKEEVPAFWIEVILPLALPKVYTYNVPPLLADQIKVGCRVEVVFGKNKKYAGIIKTIVNENPGFPTKPIIQLLDEEPLLYLHQLKLWNWIANYYMCSEGEVMSAALPANFKLSSETILLYNEEIGENFSNLSDDEYVVAEALLLKKQISLPEVQQILDVNHVYPVVKKLIEKGVCFIWEQMGERYKPKKEKFVTLNPSLNNDDDLSKLLNDWKGAPKQMEMLLAFLHLEKTEGEVSKNSLLKKSGASSAQLKALEEKNILIVTSRNIDRLTTLPKTVNINFDLTDVQQKVLELLKAEVENFNVTLFHGVTGSGKTLLYVKIIEEYLKQGKQVLYLLPEIALTAQVIRRLQVYFGGYISIYHSKFNDQERIELWNKIRTGETRIVLGVRSSLFLPFENLGLIIVDEEHDTSYKQQDPAPRYNARDTAIYYASLNGSKVILGSATPSIESYYNAVNHKYGFVKLNERYLGIELPSIEIINTSGLSQKGKIMISPMLKEAIQATLDLKLQVILFQNRRGYNPYLICASCGFIPQCQHCDVSLTMHKYSNKMHCHYCGSTYPKLVICPRCNSNKWLEKNFGTEKIEEQIEEDFSDYKIARMDVDSIRGKKAHDNLIQLFENQKLDILVGTQMVVKGLDFDHVNLVGILDADGLLSFTDFRVNERAFQLMEQVSGRAGRKNQKGKVYIQSMNVNHPVLHFVKAHDYQSLYNFEIERRAEFLYPPFCRLINITLKHKVKDIVNEASEFLTHNLRKDLRNVTGPAAPVVARVRNLFLMELLIKLPKDGGAMKKKQVIINHINLLLSQKKFSSVHIVVDVDPF